jgi:predicted amidophosphoribosyltransferase
VTTREPLWTEQDRAELIALALYRDGLCPKCGRPLDVCTSDEGKPGAPQFEVNQSLCRATRAIAETISGLTDAGKKPLRNAEARLWGTTIRKR